RLESALTVERPQSDGLNRADDGGPDTRQPADDLLQDAECAMRAVSVDLPPASSCQRADRRQDRGELVQPIPGVPRCRGGSAVVVLPVQIDLDPGGTLDLAVYGHKPFDPGGEEALERRRLEVGQSVRGHRPHLLVRLWSAGGPSSQRPLTSDRGPPRTRSSWRPPDAQLAASTGRSAHGVRRAL